MAARRNIPRQCEVCGKDFLAWSNAGPGKGRFCSRDCGDQRRKVRPLADRFWPKVQKAEGCWVWTGAHDAWGYGTIGIDRFGTMGRAHRVAYELLIGPIPEGLELDHLCRNPSCVRPDHLEPVTQRVNVLRNTSPIAQNAARTHCTRGHPFDLFNTITRADGHRNCRTCAREYGREWARRRRAQSDLDPRRVPPASPELEWSTRPIGEPLETK